jgi:alkylation response protein AidB-like acyl-CoA dehydrogenase
MLALDVEDPRRAALAADPLVDFVLKDSEAGVLCPATKLWNTGKGANMMREAVSLMGGYGITEDCPGFLANKWMDAQLEATYEGPEAVQRRQLTRDHDQRGLPGAVPDMDSLDAADRRHAPEPEHARWLRRWRCGSGR